MTGAATWLAIAFGGALGASLRWAIYRTLARPRGETLDRLGIVGGTLAVNVLGSFVLGWIASVAPVAEPGTVGLVPFGAVGVCGALTTFSTLCADALGEIRRRGAVASVLYVAAHVVLGPLAIAVGASLGT